MNMFTVFSYITYITSGLMTGLGLNLVLSTGVFVFGGAFMLLGASLALLPIIINKLLSGHAKLVQATAEGFAHLAR